MQWRTKITSKMEKSLEKHRDDNETVSRHLSCHLHSFFLLFYLTSPSIPFPSVMSFLRHESRKKAEEKANKRESFVFFNFTSQKLFAFSWCLEYTEGNWRTTANSGGYFVYARFGIRMRIHICRNQTIWDIIINILFRPLPFPMP